MITLRKLAAEVIRLESSGDVSNDTQLSEAYVILMIRQALNKMLKALIYERMNGDDRSGLQLVTASYEVDVLGESPNQYITLPEFYINLPFNKGIESIAPIEDMTNHMIPRHNPAVSRGLPCAEVENGSNSYWTRGLKVYFDNDIELGKILLSLVVAAPDSIGKDDSLPIYPEQQTDVIIMVRQMLSNAPIQDKILDGNKDIGVKIPR